MSILTKICVVIMVVASLVASVVFFNMATMPINYRAWYEQERDAYNNLEAKSTEDAADKARLSKELTQVRSDLNDKLTKAYGKCDTLEGEKLQKTTEAAQLRDQLALISSKLTLMEKSVESQRETNEKQREALLKVSDLYNKSNKEKTLLADQVKDLQKQKEMLEKNLMISQRQLEDLKAELATANKKVSDLERLAPDAVAGGTDPIAPPGIAGTLTAVRGNLASVNVGSAHGVKEGMKLVIYRGDQFVGHLKIELVQVNDASGMVVDKRLDPIQGDRVTSSASLNSVN